MAYGSYYGASSDASFDYGRYDGDYDYDKIEIKYFARETMMAMLKFFYTGELPSLASYQNNQIEELVSAAEHFGAKEVKEEIGLVLSRGLSLENVIHRLDFACRHSMAKPLKTEALAFALDNITELETRPDWVNLKEKQPGICLDLLNLTIDNKRKQNNGMAAPMRTNHQNGNGLPTGPLRPPLGPRGLGNMGPRGPSVQGLMGPTEQMDPMGPMGLMDPVDQNIRDITSRYLMGPMGLMDPMGSMGLMGHLGQRNSRLGPSSTSLNGSRWTTDPMRPRFGGRPSGGPMGPMGPGGPMGPTGPGGPI